MNPRTFRIVAAFFPVFSLAACSVSASAGKKIDGKEIEKVAMEKFGTNYGELKIDKIACPDKIEIKAEAISECKISIVNTEIRLQVTQKDDKGNLSFKILDALMGVKKMESSLTSQLMKTKNIEAKISCGEAEYVSHAPGDVFTCAATTAKGEQKISITVKDATGNVDWELV
jgi:hypothetical protein